jgi:aldehyde:ferredoxin oxidoreductase
LWEFYKEGKMNYGIKGKTLRINLSDQSIKEEELSIEYLLSYIGGDGLGARILYDEVPPGIEALDPENRLVFAAGPLVGTKAQSACLHSVITKSPTTGFTIINSHACGYWGPRLKFSGFDAIVFEGRASNPAYLYITQGKAEIRDAGHLWGLGAWATDDQIRKELGMDSLSIDAIGEAGENLIRIACIVSDKHHIASRGGVGAVMGSKNLKAVVVQGDENLALADPETFRELSRQWRKANMESGGGKLRAEFGTAGALELIHSFGDLPTRNFTTGIFPEYRKLTGQEIIEKYLYKQETCWSCSLAHNKKLKFETSKGVEIHEMPEYECLAAWGSNIGSSDVLGATYCTDACDDHGLDSLEASTAISMVMECVEKGILSKGDLGGIDLRFGNWEAALETIHNIAKKEGIGEVLAEGAIRAAERIGGGAENFVPHVKGMAIPQHDFRGLWGYALQYAVGSAGPSHEGGPGGQEMAGQLKRMSIEGKAKAVIEGQKTRFFYNNIGVCQFGTIGVPLELMVQALNAAVGEKFSIEEIKKISLRCANLRRAFNIRHGLRTEDDTLSPRLLQPPPDGPSKGSLIQIKPMVREYYQRMGWDEKTGKPLRTTLKDLGLEDVISDLWGK